MSTNLQKTTCLVKGLHCASCVAIIKKKTANLSGLKNIDINLANNQAQVEYDQSEISLIQINDTISKFGYELVEINIEKTSHQMPDGTMMSGMDHSQHLAVTDLSKLKKEVLILMPLAIIFFLLMLHHSAVSLGWLPAPFWAPVVHNQVALIIASIVLFAYGQRFIKSFLRFCRYRVADMNALVGMGTLVAYFYSTAQVLFPTFKNLLGANASLHFDVVIIVIGFITLGDYLVARSKAKTGAALEKLIGLQVKTAVVIRDNKEIKIPTSELKVGDIFLVKPGEKIAIDGEIIEGDSAIDESMITGESLPVDKKIGDFVTGATLNKQGFLKVRATQIGEKTVLSQIITAVTKAQNSKAPIQNLTDKVVAIFVPVVLSIAVLSLLIWTIAGNFSLGLICFIAILVVACPCAMGLATPIAVIVGVGKAAEAGILVKDAESLQKLSKINYVVFDKTGTITYGQPTVTANDLDDTQLKILLALEKKSEHPLAGAIVKYAEKKLKSSHLAKLDKFKVLVGQGLTAIINKQEYFAGNEKLAQKLKLKIPAQLFNQNATATPIFLMTQKKLLATIWLADEVKNNAREVIEKLHAQNIKTALLTGDRQNVADFISEQAGIDAVIAEVLPTQKSAQIKKLQSDGYRVAMVGDGINDSPALSQADVGIAMGTGSDVAIESAGITLLGGNIAKLPTSISLSRATMKTIQENLFFSFFYNAIAIPIAAGLLYPLWGIILSPAVEGAAMAFSSLSVVLNSLRLKNKKLASSYPYALRSGSISKSSRN